jgi:REP element-mobilizing transposase RayT
VAGSLPRRALQELRELATKTPSKTGGKAYVEWSRQYFALEEQLLHGSHGRTWLRRDDIADSVMSTARHYDAEGKWRLSACSVMPNHVHLFFMAGTCGLTRLMKDFKHCTARNCNELLGRKGKRFWQKEWFDHWSRSGQEDEKIRHYIQKNAVRAGLVKEWRDWPWVWIRE